MEIHVCFCIHCINCLFILTNLPEIFCFWCKKCLNIIIWVGYYTLRSHKNHYIKYLKPAHILGNADNATHPLSVLLQPIVGLIRIINPLSRRKINLNESDSVKIYRLASICDQEWALLFIFDISYICNGYSLVVAAHWIGLMSNMYHSILTSSMLRFKVTFLLNSKS